MCSDLARRGALAELAVEVHLSVPQFHRICTQSYGTSPLGYLTRLRVQELARLLRETDEPIEGLMPRLGWIARGHGARFFHQHTGMFPLEHKR